MEPHVRDVQLRWSAVLTLAPPDARLSMARIVRFLALLVTFINLTGGAMAEDARGLPPDYWKTPLAPQGEFPHN